MINRYVSLIVMFDPVTGKWEAWDTAVRPHILGLGDTPHEALFELVERLVRLGLDAPAWIHERYHKEVGHG